MKKYFYLLIALVLSVKFWELSFVNSLISKDILLFITWLWSFLAFPLFHKKIKITNLYSIKYIQYMYWILLGVFLSMISAELFWKQNISITIFTQRDMYSFILLPAILYVQPTIADIKKSLKWISILTIVIWFCVAFKPNLIQIEDDNLHSDSGEFGYYVWGIRYVLFYLYFLVDDYIKKFSWPCFLQSMLLFLFIVLYQNRSILLGASIILLYSILRFKSKSKPIIISIISVLAIGIVIYSMGIWIDLFIQTSEELSNPDYARWLSLNYFLNEHSPHWFCYIFGNGFASLNTSFGQHILEMKALNVYDVDLGMIGLWSRYGIIPIIAIYSIILKVIILKKFPLYLKFICWHILIVPTIFSMHANPHVLFFILIIYLYAYNNEVRPFHKIKLPFCNHKQV